MELYEMWTLLGLKKLALSLSLSFSLSLSLSLSFSLSFKSQHAIIVDILNNLLLHKEPRKRLESSSDVRMSYM